MRVDQTIVPWTTLWLFYFEDWLSSDEWKGGGLHPGDDDGGRRRSDPYDGGSIQERPMTTDGGDDDRRSYHILSLDGGGIRGVFPAAFSPNWKSMVAARSDPISILSLAPLPAA